MKKVALLSPHFSQNYGTILQAFALAKIINSLGAKAEYIDYSICKKTISGKVLFIFRHPSFLWKKIKSSLVLSKNLKYEFVNDAWFQNIRTKNEHFCKSKISISKTHYTYDTIKKTNSLYDIFIVGSDQTWNPYGLIDFSCYYLDFVKDQNKKNSYACSMGTTKLSNKYKRFLKKKLLTFNHLSCRENINSKALSTLLNRPVNYAIDPTLLISGQDWKKEFEEVSNLPQKFILCYILGEKKCIAHFAEHLSRKTDLPVYYIATRPPYHKKENSLADVGAPNFLWLLAHATYVVTDSFHGTIFSLNFKTNFFVFTKHYGDLFDNGRIKNILEELDIPERHIEDHELRVPEDINFDKVHILLEKLKKDSMAYLKNILIS